MEIETMQKLLIDHIIQKRRLADLLKRGNIGIPTPDEEALIDTYPIENTLTIGRSVRPLMQLGKLGIKGLTSLGERKIADREYWKWVKECGGLNTIDLDARMEELSSVARKLARKK